MVEAIVGVALRATLLSIILGGVLAGLVFLATRTLALTASTRHALWTTALVAIAVMPLAGVGVSVGRAFWAVDATAANAVSQPPSPQAAGTDASTRTAATSGRSSTGVSVSSAGIPSTAANASARSPFAAIGDRLGFVRWAPRVAYAPAVGVLGVWLTGALIGLIGLAGSIVRVRGLKRRSSPLDGPLAEELPWLTEVGPGREIYLRLSYETETPVAIGFRRPVILIPTELANADGLAAIEQLVLHEHAHLRRYDDWTNLVQRLIERIFWFNPIVWLVGRRIALEREIASDDAVVEKTGMAHAYATSLWKLAREMRMPEHAVVAPGALLTRKQITVRIERLLDAKRTRLHRSPAAALGVVIAAVAAVAFVATSAPAVELLRAPVVAAHAAPARAPIDTSAPVEVLANARTPQPREGSIAEPAGAVTPARTVRVTANVAAAFGSKSTTFVPQTKLITVDTTSRGQVLRLQLPAAAKVHTDGDTFTFAYVAKDDHSGSHRHAALSAPPQGIAPAVPGAPRGESVPVPITPSSPQRPAAVQIAAAPTDGPNGASTTRTDGVKLSRELIASCVGCSFRNTDIRGVDLHGLKISANDFTGADMRGVNLSGAYLIGVTLTRANLADADLRNAQFSGVELRDANFDGARVDGIKLIGVSIKHVSLRGVALRDIVANCTGCDFSGFDLHGQDLHGITLSGADMAHADLHDANLSGVRFTGVDLAHADLSGADLTNARLYGCELKGANLHGSHLDGASMTGSALGG